MLITKTITTEVTENIEVKTPVFYKHDHTFYGVYSKIKIIQVTNVDNRFVAIAVSQLESLYNRDKVFNYEPISQAEFETALNETAQRITNLELETA